MANSSINVSIFLKSAFVIALFLFVTMAEARSVSTGSTLRKASKVACDVVVGVLKGDTCFDLANSFNLSTAEFDAINPNLNCTALFVGQWLCVSGF